MADLTNNKIKEINDYLNKDQDQNLITPDELDKAIEEDNEKNWEGKFFLIQASDFANYDKKNKVLKSEIGKSWLQEQVDDKGNPVLDKEGNKTYKKIDKNWTEIAIPFSKSAEFIRVNNKRISGTRSNFYFNICLNAKAKSMPIYTLTGKKIQDMEMEKILKKFEAHQKSLAEHIDRYKKEQDLQKLNNNKGKESEKSK